MRRVVITGLGLLSPLGCGVEVTWQRLTAGENAAKRVEDFDVSDLTCQIACQIPRGDGSDGTFNPNDWMEPKEQRKVDDFIIYAMAAAEQALTGEGGTILGPLPAAELVASGAWARFDHVSEELLAAVRQRGADVVRMPRQDVLLVRRLGGLALAEAAAGVGCSLLELIPLTPDS